MLKFARRAVLACCLTLPGIFNVHAGDAASWHVGDTVGEDIVTPVALDVTDATATAARKAQMELKIPVIYRTHSSVTNTMVEKVTEAFDEAHSNFLAGIQVTYRKTKLDARTIQSPEFGYFITAFNFQNKRFLITTDMARQWAGGNTGLAIRTKLVELLLQTTSRPVRPDDAPDGFTLGESARLVPVHSSSDVLTLKDAEKRGRLVPLESITTVTRLRGLFRRNFQPEDQMFARQLATYIHPDCELDTKLTELARAQETSRVLVVNHYAAGQVIVRRGQAIDSQILAVLAKLNVQPPPELPAQTLVATVQRPNHFDGQNLAANSNTHTIWLATALTAGSIAVLLLIWRMLARRRRTAAANLQVVPLVQNNLTTVPTELAQQIAQALKSAVAQELALQRQELLLTQQNAAAEVLRLMHRLNELHAPWQERLTTYEKRIHELEKELSLRTEENRELLKLKIDLLRQQLEAERVNPRVNFN